MFIRAVVRTLILPFHMRRNLRFLQVQICTVPVSTIGCNDIGAKWAMKIAGNQNYKHKNRFAEQLVAIV